jgi:hypothetical protein
MPTSVYRTVKHRTTSALSGSPRSSSRADRHPCPRPGDIPHSVDAIWRLRAADAEGLSGEP